MKQSGGCVFYIGRLDHIHFQYFSFNRQLCHLCECSVVLLQSGV